MTDQEPEVTRDASDVGVACSVCSSIDFLPFTCTLCSRTFCKEHSNAAQPAEHDCPAYKSTIVPEYEQRRDDSATFKSLLPDRSLKLEIAPLTPAEVEKQKKKEAALALLHKNFPNTAPTSSKPSTSKAVPPKPANKTIMIMKLKQNAKGLDPNKTDKQVPLKERRFFFARAGMEGELKPFWLASTCPCGKALDLLATSLKVPNKNNLPTTPESERLVLVSSSAPSTPLSSSGKMGETISDGDEVWLLQRSDLTK